MLMQNRMLPSILAYRQNGHAIFVPIYAWFFETGKASLLGNFSNKLCPGVCLKSGFCRTVVSQIPGFANSVFCRTVVLQTMVSLNPDFSNPCFSNHVLPNRGFLDPCFVESRFFLNPCFANSAFSKSWFYAWRFGSAKSPKRPAKAGLIVLSCRHNTVQKTPVHGLCGMWYRHTFPATEFPNTYQAE